MNKLFINTYKSHDINCHDHARGFDKLADAESEAYNPFKFYATERGWYNAPKGYYFAQTEYGEWGITTKKTPHIDYLISDMSPKKDGRIGVMGTKIDLIKVDA